MERKQSKAMSSGARKVERVEKNARGENAAADAAQKAREEAQAAERRAADARFEAAKARSAKKEASRMRAAKKKQSALEKKLDEKQKRQEKRAAKESARAEKKAQKAARREMLAKERAAKEKARRAREKRERTAKQQQKAKAREQRILEKQERRRAKSERKQQRRQQTAGGGRRRAPGIGGWIAAVSVLGAACLALATVVTVGSVRMTEMSVRAANGYRAALYELVSVSEDLDDSFSKLRVSSGAGEQRTLLTDVLVEASLMESALEKLPLDGAASADISAFVNRTGMCARRMLQKLSAGNALSEREKALVTHLYEKNAALCAALNDLALHTPAKELEAYFEGGENGVGIRMSEIGQGAAKKPEHITDAPFTGEGNVGENVLHADGEVSAAEAQEKALGYFEGYHVRDIRMTGETSARDFKAYNFVLTDENGTEYFAQVTKNGGKLIFFDSYEACSEKNFTLENCDALAREFLAKLGYTGLTAVWFSDAGNVASVTYVADIGGVRAYPDMIRVRVCEEKGRVVGMDARGYLVNHHGKRETSPSLTEAQARAKLFDGLHVEEAHLALIPLHGREVLTYEFYCGYGEQQFILYVDAHTGDEVRIFRVHDSAQGRYLK